VSLPHDERRARISDEVRALGTLDLRQLRAWWRRRWGEVPGFRTRDLIVRAAAYRLQTDAQGELPAPDRRRLAALADRFSENRSFTPTAGPALKPGSSLIREWRGVRHEVAVIEGGFAYQGSTYASLSKVATAITGAKWNGPLFFGLKPRGKAA
jgi:hypothetical protein